MASLFSLLYINISMTTTAIRTSLMASRLHIGMASLRWLDGSEYHGEFAHGSMSGWGRYIFPPTSGAGAAAAGMGSRAEFRGELQQSLPVRGFYHPPFGDARRRADFAERLPGVALWSYWLRVNELTD